MFEFLVYLAQSAICLATLYLIYKVAMSYETLHSFNRVLLLGSVVLSALLPLCHVRIVKEYDAAPTVSAIEIDDMVVAEVAELGVDYVALLKDLAVMLFFVGVAFMLVRLAVGIYSVWRLIHSGQMSVIEEDVTLTVVDSLSSPFSWFGHIVASKSDVEQFRDMIITHEMAHISLRHSLDVLAVDLALCLWWFNPALWLLRRELQSLHEYQADEAVLNRGIDAKTYQMLLIKRAVGYRLHSVANCLNHSNLKNRITMMCKNQSSRWAATKALLVVPMVAVALSAFATTEYVPREVQNKVTENSVNLQDEEKPNPVVVIDGKVVPRDEMRKLDPNTIDNMSVFKGDKAKEYAAELDLNISADDVKEGLIVITLKNEVDTDIDGDPLIKAEKMPKFQGGDVNRFAVWMQSQIQYPAEAVEKGISGRVLFSFVVEKDGSMSEFTVLRSPDMVLSAEVERVFNSAPKAWTAGEENGQKVRVKFTVPIVFTAVADSGVSKDFASLYAAGMADIAKADALDKEISGKKYDNQADYKADMQNVNDYYKSAMSALESAYALNPQHKPTVQSLYMIAFRLRDESGMMAKYEKYKAALQNL
ncbi:MAG: M56 family metallopeptidase [Alistipes sp.]|nr:M56 family metallopeptidase [Alistipes sp.]MBQ5923244.1 M56 family metallopeptidase [Alistipes sp.]